MENTDVVEIDRIQSFRCAGCVLAGVELMHMIRKGQFAVNDVDATSFADQFYALAGQVLSSLSAAIPSWETSSFNQQRDRTENTDEKRKKN